MSICTKCGQDHAANGGVCRGVPSGKPAPVPGAQKTLFGMPSASFPLPGKPAAPPPVRASTAATPPARAVPATSPPPPAARPAAAAAPMSSGARLPAPARRPLPRLPTAEEARQDPGLVVSLETTPPAVPAAAPSSRSSAAAPAPPGVEIAVEMPQDGPPTDLPAIPDSGLALARDETPTDLPPPGSGPRFALPATPVHEPAAASGGSARRTERSLGERLLADPKSLIELLAWAAATYLRRPGPFLVLALALVLPASFLQSCLATSLLPRAPTIVLPSANPDASARKAELVKRIQDSQAQGKLDPEAAIALAELTAAEGAQIPPPKVELSETSVWLHFRLVLLVQGLLVFGLALPLAAGVLAVAFFDRESGAAFPGLADVWPILVARSRMLLPALLPAAGLAAAGYALYVVPGLLLSVLFLFVPHVVLFESKAGRDALSRSVQLVKADAIRCTLALLTFALASAVAGLLAELVLPTSASRATAFVYFLARDLLIVCVLPIPALVLARLYHDQCPGKQAESLSRAARS